ncbi:MAG: processed acidic surface protein [Bacilli bacterium]
MKKLLAILSVFVLFISTMSTVAYAKPAGKEFVQFLSDARMTEAELETYLNVEWDMSLEEFEDVEDLMSYLGAPLTEAELALLLEEMELTREELNAQLVRAGELEEGQDVMDVFHFVDDVYMYLEFDDEDMFTEEMLAELAKYGITQAEIENMYAHLDALFERSPERMDELDVLMEQLLAFEMGLMEGVESLEDLENLELTAEQMATYAKLYKELERLLEIDVRVAIEKNGKRTYLNVTEALQLQSVDNTTFIIEVYNRNKELLLDMMIKDLNFDKGDLEDIVDAVKPKPSKPSTENGGKLPNTSGDYASGALAGMSIVAVAVLAWRRFF